MDNINKIYITLVYEITSILSKQDLFHQFLKVEKGGTMRTTCGLHSFHFQFSTPFKKKNSIKKTYNIQD